MQMHYIAYLLDLHRTTSCGDAYALIDGAIEAWTLPSPGEEVLPGVLWGSPRPDPEPCLLGGIVEGNFLFDLWICFDGW